MGRCIYCDEPAGFLRRKHRECSRSHKEGVNRIITAMANTELTAEEAASEIKNLARQHRVKGKRFHRALEQAWAGCIEAGLQANGVDRAEEERLETILSRFDMHRGDVDRRGLWKKVKHARRRVAGTRVGALVHEAVHAEADSARPLAAIQGDIESAAREANIDAGELRNLLVASMETEVELVLEDDLLTEEEEQAVNDVAGHFSIGQEDLDRRGAWTRMVKAAILRDLMNGVVPQRASISGNIPFRLQKSETLIWLFNNVRYSTIRTRREFRGGHAGVSVRVAKGLYFRTGAFRGRPVQIEETVHVDTGLLGITTRHIYFAGNAKRFRVRHNKIVTIEPYSDGIGIMRDGVRAKPETFEVGDGWFAYNLLQNIEVP